MQIELMKNEGQSTKRVKWQPPHITSTVGDNEKDTVKADKGAKSRKPLLMQTDKITNHCSPFHSEETDYPLVPFFKQCQGQYVAGCRRKMAGELCTPWQDI